MPPSRSGKGRVAIVFETRSGMRVAATMPDPGRSEDRRSLENGQGQTPATRADGPSACPGDSSHERGRVSASDNPWDMQQAAKSIRVRNAGEDLLPRPGSAQRSSALGWDHCPCAAKAACGLPASKPCGRRGRGFSPSRSARPYGRRKATDDRQPQAGQRTGAMMHACSPDDIGGLRPPFLRTPMLCIGYGAIRDSCRGVSSRISLRSIRATKIAWLFDN